MQLWFARRSEVPIREQLVTQIKLGILSEDLTPGQRLPSTRLLARRFDIHPNTVSAGYRELQKQGWLEFRRGSGVYVRKRKPAAQCANEDIDTAIAALFGTARKLSVALPELRGKLRRWLETQPPDHFLLIEPDEELRKILAAEIEGVVSLRVESCGIDDCAPQAEGCIAVFLANREAAASAQLPAATESLILQTSSVPQSLGSWLPAPTSVLVGVASRWPEFLKVARAMLTAAGFPPESLVCRDGREQEWHRGLEATAAVVCDSLTAKSLPKHCRAIPFPLLAESSIAELRKYQNYLQGSMEGTQ